MVKEFPNELEPVLSKIIHQNDLGISTWFEVVYYEDGRWFSYRGSKTFNDGEKVVEWVYCNSILYTNIFQTPKKRINGKKY